MRLFEKAFKLPFKRTRTGWFLDKDENLAFQLIPVGLSEEKAEHLLNVVNGYAKPKFKNKYHFVEDEGHITVNGQSIILMRGWAYLTSGSNPECCLMLTPEEAVEIQNDLANYIVEKLSQ